MAQDKKFGTVEIPGIPEDEPIFVIRGKDAVAHAAIYAYAEIAEEFGASTEFANSAEKRGDEIREWQNANSDRVKVPD